ncbi:MAG: DNA repair protein RecN [Chitinophagaceae bacterium]|nr:DNA repair protein RecN [Chitinophagaceae bacterium]
MLKKLTIQNYAIIDELEIFFASGMNVITGETGAGKSIIVGALGLILGERADTAVLVDKSRKSVVEGSFLYEGKRSVEQFFETYELDISEEILIRREIGINGKSRAFINDTPVNLNQLQELSSLLVDLHQQFDTLDLARKDFQLDVMDALAMQFPLLEEYKKAFKTWEQVRTAVRSLREQKLQLEKEMDYFQFQFDELQEAGFKEEELEQADAEMKLLNNSEEVSKALQKASYELQEGETPLAQQLKMILQQLNAYSSMHPELNSLVERLRSTQVELQDIASGIEQLGNELQFDPARLEQLNERVSLGYKLMKKHGVRTTAELLNIKQDLAHKLQNVNDIADTLILKEKEETASFKHASELAIRLSSGRKGQLKGLETSVNKLLAQVGMPNAQLKVSFLSNQDSLNAAGMDEVEFLFDANRSKQFQPLRKVASGGELSRLMLCIKSLVADSMELPTMIFDEIDTGISGEAARQVGIIMKNSSAGRQLICITHQPQIAGKADAHYFVYKEIKKDSIRTNIRELDNEERITAIAKMLSGEKPTAAAIENAREMLN